MARKKAPAPDPTVEVPAVVALIPETIQSLVVVHEMVNDLLNDAQAEAQASFVPDNPANDDMGKVVGWILIGAQSLTRAAVVAGILPQEVMAELDRIQAEEMPSAE